MTPDEQRAELEPPEEWQPIPGFPAYEASTYGRVRSWMKFGPPPKPVAATPRILRLSKSGEYTICSLRNEHGKRVPMHTHRAVLLAFYGHPPDGHEGAHLNGHGTDNRLVNLAWVTAKVNQSHRVFHGTYHDGERVNGAKLSAETAAAIRSEAQAPGAILSHIARKYGVSVSTVSLMVHGDTWKRADGPTRAQSRREGAAHYLTRLTEEQVRTIRALRASGVPRSAIAAQMGLSVMTVKGILRGRSWKGT